MNERLRMLRAVLLGLFLGIIILFATLLLQSCNYAESCARICKIQGLVIEEMRKDKDGDYVCRCTTLEKLLENRDRERKLQGH